jgi:hypothetical protein
MLRRHATGRMTPAARQIEIAMLAIGFSEGYHTPD